MRGAPALVVLCGCHAVFGIDGVGEGPPDGGEPPDVPAGFCPASFAPLPGGSAHLYEAILNPDDFATQLAACKGKGGGSYLVVPDDQAELDALADFAAGFTFWIGIDDRLTEGTFVTANGGAATFLPWAPGEPSNGADEDCVVVLSSRQLADEPCETVHSAGCECDP